MNRTPTAYQPHLSYVAPARRRAELWRLIPSILIIAAFYLLPLLAVSTYLATRFGPAVAEGITRRVLEGALPGSMLMMLYSFSGLLLGLFAVVRLMHGRNAGTLFGPDARAVLRNFVAVLTPLLGVQVLLVGLMLTDPAVTPGLSFLAFLGFLPMALPGILIQIASEELLFRSYLQQQLAARFASPVIWMGLPSAIFAVGHYLPDEFGAGAPFIVLWAFTFGCLAADLTARTGNIGAALAFHAANNISAMLFIGINGQLDGLALWSITIDFSSREGFSALLAADFLLMLCLWLIARIALRR